jgi:Oxysterol-binding protein
LEAHLPFVHAGYSANMTFEKCKGDLAKRGRVHGTVSDPKGHTLFKLSGNMLTTVSVTPCTAAAAAAVDGSEGVASPAFVRPPDVPEVEAQFNMTQFAIGLNDIAGAASAAPTDTRHRPDVRLLENAQYERATSEKVRLEEKQRATARARAAESDEYVPCWFVRSGGHASDQVVKKDADAPHVWQFNGDYWRSRESGAWQRSPDIYSAPQGEDKQ